MAATAADRGDAGAIIEGEDLLDELGGDPREVRLHHDRVGHLDRLVTALLGVPRQLLMGY